MVAQEEAQSVASTPPLAINFQSCEQKDSLSPGFPSPVGKISELEARAEVQPECSSLP